MKTVIFGVGKLAQSLAKKLGGDILFVDTFRTSDFQGHAVHLPTCLIDHSNIKQIIICSINGFEEILTFLKTIHIPYEKIFVTDYNLDLVPVRNHLEFQKKGILVCTLPKSGTIWLRKGLHEATRRKYSQYKTDLFRRAFDDKAYINPGVLKRMTDEGGIYVGHYMCGNLNNKVLEQAVLNGLKIILHFRDPRQALISFLYYLDKTYNENDHEMQLLKLTDYFRQEDFNGRLLFLVEHWFPRLINWLSRWKVFLESIDANLVLVTRHENLATDSQRFNKTVCNYLGVGENQLNLDALPKKGINHFRNGQIDEWKSIIPPGVIRELNKQLEDYDLVDFVDSAGLF